MITFWEPHKKAGARLPGAYCRWLWKAHSGRCPGLRRLRRGAG